jgi:hypothetical protein
MRRSSSHRYKLISRTIVSPDLRSAHLLALEMMSRHPSTTSHAEPEKLGSKIASIQGSDNLPEVLAVSAPNENGIKGWATVFGAFWGLFATAGQLNSFGSYQAYYVKHELSSYSASDVSWIGSLQVWVFFFSVCYACSISGYQDAQLYQGAFIGRLFDTHGPKRLILAGAVTLTLGLMITSLCTTFYQFILAQGILVGIGMGLV